VAPAAPTISSFSPDSGVVGDDTTDATILTLTGTAAANSTVEVFDGSTELGTVTANGSGAWSYTTGTLANGSHSFTATDTVVGIVSPASTAMTVTVETVAPAAPVIATDTINGNTATLNGTAAANSTVTVYEQPSLLSSLVELGTTQANGSGSWSFVTGALASGSYIFYATATNAAGTSAYSAGLDPVIGQSTVPTIVSFSPASGAVGNDITNATTLTLTGTAAANSTVEVFDGSNRAGHGDGEW
jgi:hypothetical protein